MWAPGPSFISQSASVAADAGAANTTPTTTAAVRDRPSPCLIIPTSRVPPSSV